MKRELDELKRRQRWLKLRGWKNPRNFAVNVLQHTVFGVPKYRPHRKASNAPSENKAVNQPMHEIQPYRLDRKKLFKKGDEI